MGIQPKIHTSKNAQKMFWYSILVAQGSKTMNKIHGEKIDPLAEGP